MVKNLPANAGHTRDMGLIPGLGRSLGVGNGNPLQYSCLENPMDRQAWRATVWGRTELEATEWQSPGQPDTLQSRVNKSLATRGQGCGES